jgi:hypothetical protein
MVIWLSLLRKSQVQISARRPGIPTEVCPTFPQSLQANAGRVPRATTASFHILYNSLRINHPIIRHYIVWAPKDKKKVRLSRYMPWRRMGERRYSSYSYLTSAPDGGEWSASRPSRALPPGKGPPVPIGQEDGWAPKPVWTQGLEEKSSAPVGDRTSIARSSSPYSDTILLELPRLIPLDKPHTHKINDKPHTKQIRTSGATSWRVLSETEGGGHNIISKVSTTVIYQI